MPITIQASKKLRRDKRRTEETRVVRAGVRTVVKTMRTKPTEKALSSVFTTLDKAAKRNVIHPNKAARLKSRLAKLLRK